MPDLHPLVYLLIEPVQPLLYPAYAHREDGITLLFADPRALKAEVALWMREHMTEPERLTMRLAYEVELDLNHYRDDLLEGTVEGSHIPDMLRVPEEALLSRSA